MSPNSIVRLKIKSIAKKTEKRAFSKNGTYFGGESSITDCAFERPLFRVASIVNLKGRVAGERLETEIARGVSSACK